MKKERAFLLLVLVAVLCACKSKSTIDEEMQKKSSEMLKASLNSTLSDSAVLVVMDTRTGEIRTGVKLIKDVQSGVFKPAPSGRLDFRTQPGGIVIPLTVMGAMDECQIALPDEVNAGKGILVLHGSTVYDQDVFEKGGYGMIDLGKCVTLPSFVGTVRTLETVFEGNLELFEKRMRSMSLGKPDDENPFDNTPVFDSKMNAFSVGFYFKLSPLQLVAAWNGMANHGTMLKPAFKVSDTATINASMCKPATVQAMRTLLKENAAAEYGSSVDMAFLKNVNSIKNEYKREVTATFAGWFPADDPHFTCLLALYRTELPESDPQAGKSLLLKEGKTLFSEFAKMFTASAGQ